MDASGIYYRVRCDNEKDDEDISARRKMNRDNGIAKRNLMDKGYAGRGMLVTLRGSTTAAPSGPFWK